nr:hypothetical protein [Haladaptatus sp. R4]
MSKRFGRGGRQRGIGFGDDDDIGRELRAHVPCDDRNGPSDAGRRPGPYFGRRIHHRSKPVLGHLAPFVEHFLREAERGSGRPDGNVDEDQRPTASVCERRRERNRPFVVRSVGQHDDVPPRWPPAGRRVQ